MDAPVFSHSHTNPSGTHNVHQMAAATEIIGVLQPVTMIRTKSGAFVKVNMRLVFNKKIMLLKSFLLCINI